MLVTVDRVAIGFSIGALAFSIILALALSDRALTPLLFFAKPELIPGIKWVVLGLLAVAFSTLFTGATRGFGLATAGGLALSNLVALSLNGLGAILFANAVETTDRQSVLVALFLAAQVVVLLASAGSFVTSPSLRRSRQTKWALALVVAAAVGQWMLAQSAR